MIGSRRVRALASALARSVALLALVCGAAGCAAVHAPPAPAGDQDPGIGISRADDARLSPSPPTCRSVHAAPDGGREATWDGSGDDRIVAYQVYRRATGDASWRPVARVRAVGDNRGRHAFRDAAPARDGAVIYGVSAVDVYGHESPIAACPAVPAR